MSSELLLELSLPESIESMSELELASLVLEEDGEGSSSGGVLLVLLCDSSVRALRVVVRVFVRVSVLAASERSFVTAPMSELVLVSVEADGVVDGEDAPAELALVPGIVALLLDELSAGGAVEDDDDDDDDVLESELSLVLESELSLGAERVVERSLS